MAKIVTPGIRRTYKTLIKQVVEDLNKPIIVSLPPETANCPNCIYDSINKKSSGTYDSTFVTPVDVFGKTIQPQPSFRNRCPVCLGVGYLTNAIDRNVKALVKWNPGAADDIESTPIGREGAAIVRIKVLRTDFDLVKNGISFLVDGVRYELIRPPTIRGLGTQEELVVAFLQEVEPGTNVKK